MGASIKPIAKEITVNFNVDEKRDALEMFVSCVISGDWDERLLSKEAKLLFNDCEEALAKGEMLSDDLVSRFVEIEEKGFRSQ